MNWNPRVATKENNGVLAAYHKSVFTTTILHLVKFHEIKFDHQESSEKKKTNRKL